MIRVRRMLRPEDTNIKNPGNCDLNLVFYTEKENVVSAERIEGKIYIRVSIIIFFQFKSSIYQCLNI